ncbi:hypothetical protein M8C21_031346 [Ambrosia artemisiifolia]|uniref:Uncharacterized protein n=1 Tax=Ambrosia artemisiifolia TaxID=4212 RepID=A0AAD5BKS5_AMBAR|nr:hypothetical protein M8C21_031346 [Ambrosia artemisiifolia]
MEMIHSETASPALLRFGRSPVVRQLRVTDFPFPVNNVEEDNRVDEVAEHFIKPVLVDGDVDDSKSSDFGWRWRSGILTTQLCLWNVGSFHLERNGMKPRILHPAYRSRIRWQNKQFGSRGELRLYGNTVVLAALRDGPMTELRWRLTTEDDTMTGTQRLWWR